VVGDIKIPRRLHYSKAQNLMKKYLLLICLVFAMSPFLIAQQEDTQEEKIEQELKEGLSEVKESLKQLEIPEMDLEKIVQEIEKVMPSQEQLTSAKAIMIDAVEEIEKIDLEPLMGVLQDLKSIFEEHANSLSKTKKI